MVRQQQQGRDKAETRWLLGGYAGLTAFFAMEALLRQPGTASSMKASDDDRGTTRAIAIAYGVAIDIPLIARRIPRGSRPLPPAVAPLGIFVQVAGISLRAWSMRTLGQAYSRTLRTDNHGHDVIDSGPYRLVRHPGYLGSLLTWTGFALTSRSGPVVILTIGLLGAAYTQRIGAEEALLSRDLPRYAGYAERTKKLIPYLW